MEAGPAGRGAETSAEQTEAGEGGQRRVMFGKKGHGGGFLTCCFSSF